MITKKQFDIATKILDLNAIYVNASDEVAFKIYEMCKGNLDYMEKLLDLAVECFVDNDNLIHFIKDAINGTDIIIDDDGQFIGYREPFHA